MFKRKISQKKKIFCSYKNNGQKNFKNISMFYNAALLYKLLVYQIFQDSSGYQRFEFQNLEVQYYILELFSLAEELFSKAE